MKFTLERNDPDEARALGLSDTSQFRGKLNKDRRPNKEISNSFIFFPFCLFFREK